MDPINWDAIFGLVGGRNAGIPLPIENSTLAPLAPVAGDPNSLGGSLMPQLGGGPYGGSPATNPNLQPIGGPAGAGSAITNALRGLTVPKPPAPQTVHTPAAPRPSTAIHSGELLNLLQMLNVAGQNQGGLKLPSTLGAALGGR